MESTVAAAGALPEAAAPAHAGQDAAVFGRRNLVVAAVLFATALLTLVGYQARFGIPIIGVTEASHFVYQADAWLHGRWDVALPPGSLDTAYVHGKVYILYPPFPALALLPFVTLFGLRTSDVLFTAVCSALNLPLIYLLFEQVRAAAFTRRLWLENLILAVLLYFGSISLWLSLGGRMWFTAHIVCLTCTLLSLLLAFRRRFGWAAVLLGCAFFTRATLVLGFPLLLYLAWQSATDGTRLRRFAASLWARRPDWAAVPWRRLAPVLGVLAATLALYMWRNLALYGSPLETGYDIVLRQQYHAAKDGLFSVNAIPANVVADFFSFPRVIFAGPEDRHPLLDMLNGGIAVSVWVTTPLFLGLILWRNRAVSPLRVALWATVAAIVAALLPFHEAGWAQFGARYLFDTYPYAFLLLALNDQRVDWRWALLGIVGIVVNVLGAHQFWTSEILVL
jgi:hypothetical protein